MSKIDGHKVKSSKKQQSHSMEMVQDLKKSMVKKEKALMKLQPNFTEATKLLSNKTLTKLLCPTKKPDNTLTTDHEKYIALNTLSYLRFCIVIFIYHSLYNY